MQGRGEQVLYLSTRNGRSCFTHPIIVHELMHAIGLEHEHSRNDRGDYITVDENNVDEGKFFRVVRLEEKNIAQEFSDKKHNLKKVDESAFTSYGCPYTYESVMHYASDAFAKPGGGLTMVPKDASKLDVIGKVQVAHPNDYEKINRMYNCDQHVADHTCKKVTSCLGCLLGM